MQQQAEPSLKNATLMHAMLMAGTLVFAVVALTIGPMLENAQVVGYALAGVSVLVQLLAWMVFRPRIVPRPAATSEEEYWGDLDRFRSAMMLWTIVEGGRSSHSWGGCSAGTMQAWAWRRWGSACW